MTRSFLGREDLGLTERLLTELPGILLWALDGLDRLVKAKHFTASTASEDMVRVLHDAVSPMSAFVRDRCELLAGAETPVAALFGAWTTWCDDNGRDNKGTVQTFGRDLLAVAPHLRSTRPSVGGERERCYFGIALRSVHNGLDRGPRAHLGCRIGLWSAMVRGLNHCGLNLDGVFAIAARRLRRRFRTPVPLMPRRQMRCPAAMSEPVRRDRVTPPRLARSTGRTLDLEAGCGDWVKGQSRPISSSESASGNVSLTNCDLDGCRTLLNAE
jgi:hypothetical protein